MPSQKSTETIRQRLGHFVYRCSFKNIPPQVIEKGKTSLINGIGIGISCHDIESAKMARRLAKSESGTARRNGATIFCDGSKVSLLSAAFANSCLFHSRAQEDTLGTTHAGTIIIPAALVLAEKNGNSGKEVLEAIIAGYEIAGTLDRNLSAFTTPRGFRASTIFGIIGCAAAASKLLKLSEEQTINALGFAASFAGGTLECFAAGTMEWRFGVGVASREGIGCALIAAEGGTSAPLAFEGKAGYLNALANTQQNSEKIGKDLGKVWEILNAGFKPYASCAFNQTPLTVTLELVRKNKADYRKIAHINVRMSPYEANYPGMASKGPFSSIEGTLMSTPFMVGLACVENNITLAGECQFDEPRILGLIKKTDVIADDSMPRYSAGIEITMNDGTKYSREMKVEMSYYNFDMPRVIELVKSITAETGVSQDKVDKMISLVRKMDKLPNVRELTQLLGSCP
jgi:2-methylcitrate dehydratase PrpD